MKKDIMHNNNNNTPADELKKFIEDVIEKAYATYNAKSTAKVEVNHKKNVEIWFDSEQPYLDRNFWKLLDDVATAIKERIEKEGYIREKSNVFYDFIIWHYVYAGEEEGAK